MEVPDIHCCTIEVTSTVTVCPPDDTDTLAIIPPIVGRVFHVTVDSFQPDVNWLMPKGAGIVKSFYSERDRCRLTGCRRGYLYAHKTDGSMINDEQGLKNALLALAEETGLLDVTKNQKVYIFCVRYD